MAEPSTKYTTEAIANWNWTFTTDSGGCMSYEQIQCAALMEIVKELRKLNSQVLSVRQCHEVRDALRGIRGIMKVVNQYAKPVPSRKKRHARTRVV